MKLIKFLIAFILIAESTFLSAMPLKKDTTYVTIGIDKVTKLWDKAEHNAFTDLIRFNNEF